MKMIVTRYLQFLRNQSKMMMVNLKSVEEGETKARVGGDEQDPQLMKVPRKRAKQLLRT